MRYCLRIVCVLILAFRAGFSSPAKADVDISVFVEALSPYGTWLNHPLYGHAWFPRGMPAGWRPYTDGHWVFTVEFGWTWESDWEWGWAPFHYGRWVWDDWYGWIWIPGRVWAPAWVFWRFGGGFVAWAPMPPDVLWWPGFGLRSPRFMVDRDLPWDFWICVQAGHFPSRLIQRHILSPTNNINVINITQNVTNIVQVDNRIVNRSISLQPIEQAFGGRITAERVRLVDDLATPRGERGPGELTVIRPRRLEALSPSGEREQRDQEELINRIANDRDARRQTQPEQVGSRAPRRLLGSPPEGGAGRPEGERPPQIQEQDQGRRQELPPLQEPQPQREEPIQRQREMERRGMERRRQEEPPRPFLEPDKRQQELQRQQREEQMQRQQEMERRGVEQQRQEEQARQLREQQRQQEQQQQRLEMQRRQESERRMFEQPGQMEQPRQIQERPQRQQGPQRQQEQTQQQRDPE